MRSLLLLLAVAIVACAPPRLPQPTSRDEACARTSQAVDLGMWEFCDLNGAARCGVWNSVPTVCRVRYTGAQTVCAHPAPAAEDPNVPPTNCLAGNAGADCPPWWRCVRMTLRDGGPEGNYCVPGPPCSAGVDAGADQ